MNELARLMNKENQWEDFQGGHGPRSTGGHGLCSERAGGLELSVGSWRQSIRSAGIYHDSGRYL